MNNFKRRDFLRGASTLAGALALPVSLTRIAQAQIGGAAAPLGQAKPTQIARGVVYLDRDGSGKRLPGSKGIPNVRVSNGRDIVVTDAQGRYELPVSDDTIIFIQKPKGYRTTLDENNLPGFYHIHKPAGSPTNFKYAGIAPTGALPTSIDFGLVKQDESNQYRVLLWGDPQPRNLEEVDFIAHDIAQELMGVKATFGISLGDNAFNNLSTLEPLNQVTGKLGLPWYNVIGNHDINFEAPDDELSAETFKRIYGPTYYSFDYGSTHYVVLDNVKWLGPNTPLKNGNYTGGFGEKQLAWFKNDLAGVPRNQLVVVFMHIPIEMAAEMVGPDGGDNPRFIKEDQRAFFEILQSHPNNLSVSAHTHFQYHAYIGREAGWNGAEPHHHFNCGTTSGSWWSGAPDEQGIPNTTMRDGTPNGYAFLNVNGSDYTIDWQVARSRADYQMTVYTPSDVKAGAVPESPLQVNFFNGCEKTTVEWKVGDGKWAKMDRFFDLDPGYVRLKDMEALVPAFTSTEAKKPKTPWRALPTIEKTPHLWRANLPALPAGTHNVQIRATDRWNRVFEEKRLVRVA
ncbi:metallophosphoesterase [bacterium]|nr:MAG: metallophosphoesterase [bacterium]